MATINIHLKSVAPHAGKLTAECYRGLDARIEALARRFDAIEKSVKADATAATTTCPKTPDVYTAPTTLIGTGAQDTIEVAALRRHCAAAGLTSATFAWVPNDYYSRPLDWRRQTLRAGSVNQLCKSIILENTHCTRSDCKDRQNARYYVALFQYVERFDAEKLMRFVHGMNPDLGKKKFNFRVCDKGEDITGFSNNAIPPFGFSKTWSGTTEAVDIPIVLSRNVAATHQFWMGGGHVDCKLRADTKEFLALLTPFVADITNPIPTEDLARM